ncbi:MAG TPA: zf-HC2 domain-containing protein [Gemmatimonadales bacterium]|nr:zf-HC2 domain-containing protein [Gemmatimonadales bacterium]
MRHIPEDELHAYLDQGLSRSQCVEIESHLAACASCQANRDGIAALRDRTTALLARLAPPRSFPAPFDTLRRRAAAAASARRQRIHLAGWAASVVAALVLGWTASLLLRAPDRSTVGTALPYTARPAAAKPTTAPTATPAALRPVEAESTKSRRTRLPSQRPRRTVGGAQPPLVTLSPVTPVPALELSSVDISRAQQDLELDGMWRTVSWDGAQAEAGDKLPHIDGLPVVQVQVQVQASQQGAQPLMVVAQQLSSGEVIRTIEGPVTDVSQLLSRRTMSDPSPSASTADSARSDTVVGYEVNDRTMAMQRGDRMIAITGALPPDSLLAMIRRLNAEMRSK